MKKQLLLIVSLLSIAASAFAVEVEIDGLWYEVVTKVKEAKVVQYKNNNYYSGDIVIPETVEYNGVTCSVTSIGKNAFQSCSISSIAIGNSVTSIGNSAFWGCASLTSVNIPNSVTSIEDFAFCQCFGLSSITIPKSVTSIGSQVFAYCTVLTSVTIPNSVTSIGSGVFYNCSGLTSATIPNSVTIIGSDMFKGCRSLTSVTIPNSVTSIGISAFDGCTGLTSVTIGNSVTSIGSQAFANCTDLADVFCYAENVPSTETNAFDGSYIEYVTLHVPSSSVDAYKAREPWSGFKTFKVLDGTIIETKKCATPTIAVVGGKLTFDCETEGVKFITDYKYNGGSTVEGKEVVLGGKTICHVSVYATKEGYEDSDTATCDVELAVGKKGDTNVDGKVDVEDVVETVNIILGE